MSNEKKPKTATEDTMRSFAQMAVFLEEFQEYLEVKLSHWLLTQYTKYPDAQSRWTILSEFVTWVREEVEADLHAKRGHTGMSYADARRSEASSGDPQGCGDAEGQGDRPGEPRSGGIPDPPGSTGCQRFLAD